MDFSLGGLRHRKLLGLWAGNLAREAQQQAEREERPKKGNTGKLGLTHESDYNGSYGF
jgi:hypothetical protein